MTPVRLSKLLDGFSPALAWQAVRAGTHPADPRRRFTAAARATDVDEVGASYDRAGVAILLPGWIGYPSMLIGDPGAPAVLFALGDPTVVEDRPRVAIVGTRSATHYGRQVASELAADLVAEGVVVVSGLARGIDGAAHAGALRADVIDAAPPVAVVGTGLDIVYPSSNTMLWEQVADTGSGVLRIGHGNEAPSRSVSGPQPNHRCALRRGGHRREPPWWRLPLHRGRRRPTIHSGMRCPGIGDESGLGGYQCPARSTGALRYEMPPMCWWRSPWPGPGRTSFGPTM